MGELGTLGRMPPCQLRSRDIYLQSVLSYFDE